MLCFDKKWLAHISWPWTDECIAVFGKFRAAHREKPNISCEMFVDVFLGKDK